LPLVPRSPTPLRPKPTLGYFITGFVLAQILSVAQFFYIPIVISTTVRWGTFALGYFLISSQISDFSSLFVVSQRRH